MASNLNKAFMRAYAKDRLNSSDEPPAAATNPAPAAPQATHVAAPTAPTVASPAPVVAARPMPVAQPSMEPMVFAGRYSPHDTPPHRPEPAQPGVTAASTARGPVQPVVPSSNAPVNVHRIPAPGVQRSSSTASPANTQAQPRIITAPPKPSVAASAAPKQPAVGQPATSAASFNQPRTDRPAFTSAPTSQPQHPQAPLGTRVVQQPATASDEATRVWQRLDAAHSPQPTQPTHPPARPTVTASVARTAAPKRMQAAAAAPPVAPPAPASTLRVDDATDSAPASARHLPLLGDETSAANPSQPADARRKTVADFCMPPDNTPQVASWPALKRSTWPRLSPCMP